MNVLDLKGGLKFSPDHHVYTFLAETPHCSISIVGWEPGQTSPIHSHPTADEIYYVIEGRASSTMAGRSASSGRVTASSFPPGRCTW